MQIIPDNYFAAYRSLVVQVHTDGGPCTFSALHFIQPLKERIVREVGYGLSLEGASSAALVKSKQAKSEPVAKKRKSA